MGVGHHGTTSVQCARTAHLSVTPVASVSPSPVRSPAPFSSGEKHISAWGGSSQSKDEGSMAEPRNADLLPVPVWLRFPRLKDRGPIEARPACHSRPCLRRFPRLKDRGPIEAWASRGITAFPAWRFPRLKDRGPIEASLTIRALSAYRQVSAVERPRPN